MTQVALINTTTVDDNLATACRICGRKLTSPKSRQAGMGAVCAKRQAQLAAQAQAAHDVREYDDPEIGRLVLDMTDHQVIKDTLDYDAMVQRAEAMDCECGIDDVIADIMDTLDIEVIDCSEYDADYWDIALPDGWHLIVDKRDCVIRVCFDDRDLD